MPTSNVVALAIPDDDGFIGSLTARPRDYLLPGGYLVNWTNVVQGYRLYQSNSPTGPFSLVGDTGFQLDAFNNGSMFQTGRYPVGTRECIEVQGYSQFGHLGRMSTPVCVVAYDS
ncbi:MAG: hypothetical protein ACLPYS_01155 [Vulcanimicrobiaceae bacterium]